MAVSFNVPKQTKRSKFVVDQFKGVDFTNAGIDVDPTRSPNAPNMIRHTPGKVRKRMGYEKQIQFGSVTNVNFAKGTSAVEREIEINESDIGQSIPLYDLIENIEAGVSDITIYYEFDHKSEYGFSVDGLTISASEDWTHYSGTKTIETGTEIDGVEIVSSAKQEVFIKNFALMKSKDTNYKWRPAPGQMIEDAGTNVIYGCHSYRSSAEENKLPYVNVNRALNTSNTFQTYSLSGSQTIITEFAEPVWRNGNERRNVCIEFDYTLTGTSDALFYVASYSSTFRLTPTSTTKHYSWRGKRGDYGIYNDNIHAILSNAGATGTLSIKNLFVGYDKNDNYQWSKAPEDTGTAFTDNLYWTGNRNFASVDSYYNTLTANTDDYVDYVDVTQSTDPGIDSIKGFARISFDLTCTSSSASGFRRAFVRVMDSNNDVSYGKRYDQTSFNGSFDLFICARRSTDFLKRIHIQYEYNTSGSRTITTNITNIKLREITPREAYDVISDKYNVLHVGNKFWLRSNNDRVQKMYTGASARKSWSAQMGENLIILDGTNIYSYSLGQVQVTPLSDTFCYTPTVTISKNPNGGGTSYEPLNMLSPAFIEQFVVTSDYATSKTFQLSFNNLDNRTVRAWVLTSNGNWDSKVQGTDFTVNRTTGVVTFVTAPGVSPISGQDNVKIEAYHTVQGYRDRVAKCRFGIIYGINGRPDRLFVGGNPDFPSQDFFSEQNDYTYFPDINYSSLGSSGGKITGYAYIGNHLGTFKKEDDNAKSMIIREGELIKNETYSESAQGFVNTGTYTAQFNIINSLQGEGPVSPFAIGYLNTEPLYLTKKGIFALATQDVTGTKYGQNRSFYLNGQLNEEPNLEEGYSTVFNEMYILALNNHLYILDGLQPTVTENEPYSARQYSGFYCDNIPATCIWNDGDNLYFGTADGKICKFYNRYEDTSSYNDDGYPIDAWWETPDLDGYLFYKNKTFRYFAVRMMHAFRTSYKLFVQKQSVWSYVKEDDATGRVFTFEEIDFGHFSFNTDWSEKVSHTKLRVKKVDKARFKLENSNLNEPFGIYDLALEYLENGNYKR